MRLKIGAGCGKISESVCEDRGGAQRRAKKRGDGSSGRRCCWVWCWRRSRLAAGRKAGRRTARGTCSSAAMREEQARNDSLLLTERYPAEVDREAIVIPQPEGLFE